MKGRHAALSTRGHAVYRMSTFAAACGAWRETKPAFSVVVKSAEARAAGATLCVKCRTAGGWRRGQLAPPRAALLRARREGYHLGRRSRGQSRVPAGVARQYRRRGFGHSHKPPPGRWGQLYAGQWQRT